jgi:Cu/Ag efflux pump CusA
MRRIKGRYRSILLDVEKTPRLVIAAVAALTLLGLAALPFFETSFLPELK